jgi:S-formylglutathione hydrolase FrmB
MKKTLILSVFVISLALSASASVDTINIYSNSMFKSLKCVVITPTSYKKSGPAFPVVYLLHGFNGKYSDWVIQVPEMQKLADENQLMIVCPDGGNSWYFDSPIDLTMHYETYVGIEIPRYIDSIYQTVKDRKGRAITGLSMGGHGGSFLGFRHADLFGACGSMSGALDVSRVKKGYDVEKRLGDTVINRQQYIDWSAINVIEKYPKDSLAIMIDCGTEDNIIDMNRRTHAKMLQLKIPHDYTERPGKHNWEYWSVAIKYQLLFFREYFKTGKI